MIVSIEETDRQLILLALARLGLDRPGFAYAAEIAASKLGFNASDVYKSFVESNADICGHKAKIDKAFEELVGKST